MAAVWQHPGWANLKRYSSLLSRCRSTVSCLHLDTHKGLEFNFPGVQSFSEKRKKKHEKKKSVKQKPYRLSGVTEKILNAISLSLSLKKKYLVSHKKKKTTSQIMVNGCVCVFLILSFKSLKKKKKTVLPPPQSHTLSINSLQRWGRDRK